MEFPRQTFLPCEVFKMFNFYLKQIPHQNSCCPWCREKWKRWGADGHSRKKNDRGVKYRKAQRWQLLCDVLPDKIGITVRFSDFQMKPAAKKLICLTSTEAIEIPSRRSRQTMIQKRVITEWPTTQATNSYLKSMSLNSGRQSLKSTKNWVFSAMSEWWN